jgi:hypothetical protein
VRRFGRGRAFTSQVELNGTLSTPYMLAWLVLITAVGVEEGAIRGLHYGCKELPTLRVESEEFE